MEQKKIRSGKESGLSLKECTELMKGKVYQYNSAGISIYNNGVYIRTRTQNQRPKDNGHRGAWDVYILTEDREIVLLLYNTKSHRAKVALDSYKNKDLSELDAGIWNNYITNGYNTQMGLFRSNNNIDRIKQIARSHADYLGCESWNSTQDHDCRVMMRN